MQGVGNRKFLKTYSSLESMIVQTFIHDGFEHLWKLNVQSCISCISAKQNRNIW